MVFRSKKRGVVAPVCVDRLALPRADDGTVLAAVKRGKQALESFTRCSWDLAPGDCAVVADPLADMVMNWRRKLFRLWIGASALFVLAVAFTSYSEIKSHAEVPWATLEMRATIAFGIPLVVLVLGWAFVGSAAKRS